MFSFSRLTKSFVICVAAVSLNACGGGSGGGGGGGIAPPPPSGGGSSTNSPPRFTSATSFTFEENNIINFTLTVADDDGDTITITDETGGDGALFVVDPNTGVVALNLTTFPSGALDFEDPRDVDANNIYEQNVTLSDGKVSVTETITVEITNLYERGTCENGTEFNIPEGTTDFSHTFQTTDIDALEGNFTDLVVGFASNGTDAEKNEFLSHFNFDSSTGEVTLVSAIDYEASPNFFMERHRLETRYGLDQGEGRTDCSISILVTDQPANAASGFALDTDEQKYLNTRTLGDFDGDGIEELWIDLIDDHNFDNVFDSYMLLGSQISENLNVDFAGSVAIDELKNIGAIHFKTNGSTHLDAQLLGDIDGDGINEVAIYPGRAGLEQPDSIKIVKGGYIQGQLGLEVDFENISGSDQALILSISPRGPIFTGTGELDGDGLPDLFISLPEHETITSDRTTRATTFVVFGSTLQTYIDAGSYNLAEAAIGETVRIGFDNDDRLNRGRVTHLFSGEFDSVAGEDLVLFSDDGNHSTSSPTLMIIKNTAIDTYRTTGELLTSFYLADSDYSEIVSKMQDVTLAELDGDGILDLIFTGSRVLNADAAILRGSAIRDDLDNGDRFFPIRIEDSVTDTTQYISLEIQGNLLGNGSVGDDYDGRGIPDLLTVSGGLNPEQLFVISSEEMLNTSTNPYRIDNVDGTNAVAITTPQIPGTSTDVSRTIFHGYSNFDDDILEDTLVSWWSGRPQSFIIRSRDLMNAFASNDPEITMKDLLIED